MNTRFTHPNRRSILATAGALSLLGATAPATIWAQGVWPTRPIRFIVPFASGISADYVARLIAEPLGAALGQPVVVDNRPGAAGMIGTELAAKSPADGHTLLLAVDSIIGVLPHIHSNVRYRPLQDLQPITQITRVPWVVVANPKQPFNTFPAMLTAAKSKPGGVSYGSLGIGSGSHMRMEMISSMAGVKLSHVPYSTSPITDVIAGHIPLTMDPATTAVPMIKSGKLKALAVTSARRIDALPDVPTVAETLAGFDADGWHGLFVPAGTPAAVVDRYSRELAKIITGAGFRKQLAEVGVEAVGDSASSFAATVRQEYAKWGQLARANNIRVE